MYAPWNATCKEKRNCPANGKCFKDCEEIDPLCPRATATLESKNQQPMQWLKVEEASKEKEYICSVTSANPRTLCVCALQMKAASYSTAIFATMQLAQRPIWFQLDCEASWSVIPSTVKQQHQIGKMWPRPGDVTQWNSSQKSGQMLAIDKKTSLVSWVSCGVFSIMWSLQYLMHSSTSRC